MGYYFRNWSGRFEAINYRRPDPWLLLPATALLALGLLMVLNTTYFLAQEKSGDPFHLFKLQLAHIVAGTVVLILLSQFSADGLRRLTIPLMIIAGGNADRGLDSRVRCDAEWSAALGTNRADVDGTFRASEVRKCFFSSGLSCEAPGCVPGVERGPLPAMIVTGAIAVLFDPT